MPQIGKRAKRSISKYNREVKTDPDFERVKIDCGDVALRQDLRELLLINVTVPADLVASMADLPSLYGYWANVREEIEDHLAALLHDYEVWHAQVYDEVASSLPKSTEAAKEAQIVLRFKDEYTVRKGGIRETTSALNRVKRVLLKPLEHKASMLQSIGAMVREDYGAHHRMSGSITSRETKGNLANVKGGKRRDG